VSYSSTKPALPQRCADHQRQVHGFQRELPLYQLGSCGGRWWRDRRCYRPTLRGYLEEPRCQRWTLPVLLLLLLMQGLHFHWPFQTMMNQPFYFLLIVRLIL
jgi:hypothetical protein